MVATKGKGPCQQWHGTARKSDGRPMLGKRYAYRVLFEAVRGPIPKGMVAHHRCGNPKCVNVWHIDLMTQSEHMKSHGFGGDDNVGQRDKTHCPAGHPYDDQNTYRWRNERQCRACRRAIKLRSRRAQQKPSGDHP